MRSTQNTMSNSIGHPGWMLRTKHQIGQPYRRHTGEGEEHPVHHVHYRGPPLPAAPDRHELIVVRQRTLRHQQELATVVIHASKIEGWTYRQMNEHAARESSNE